MIQVEELTKIFETRNERLTAIDSVSFEVATGEMVTLLGPSGCGKTTTLRCIAGLERPIVGRITIENQPVVDCAKALFTPAHRRRIGMVFQSYAIWPHMTVYENVAYALEGERMSRGEIRRRTTEALALCKLENLADRPAPRLSGGQQQRVAIARAVAGNPHALLFDEPLSNLDAKLRATMRTELRRLQQELGITSIYVTHDQSEALAISDWIIVMRNGRIVEHGRPAEIYTRPRTLFTAHFIGDTNLIRGRVVTRSASTGEWRVDTALGHLGGIDPNGDLREGDAVRLSIRPEDLSLIDGSGRSTDNRIVGTIADAIFRGSYFEAELRAKDHAIQCYLPRDAKIMRGDEVRLCFETKNAVILRDDELDGDQEGGSPVANAQPADMPLSRV
jgi:iron(III) transport system ATP-binding protein